MNILPWQTLLIFLIGFGFLGASRGASREIWTLGGLSVVAIMIYVDQGGETFRQLPVRLMASLQALVGNQTASNETAHHPLADNVGSILLFACVVALIFLAYFLGNSFGDATKSKIQLPGFAGLLIGMLNGLIIGLFIFRQINATSAISFQMPTDSTTQAAVVPLVLLAIVVAGTAVVMSLRSSTSSSGK